jgi:hypothetical protein
VAGESDDGRFLKKTYLLFISARHRHQRLLREGN